jgi:molybdopterin-guanine dinucleotide biosynthesis protein MobB
MQKAMASLPAIITVSGLKGSGKTAVVEALIGELRRRGLRVASAKSMTHGTLELQPEGTDTRRHLEAGAEAVLAFAADATAVFSRPLSGTPQARLEHLGRSLPAGIDWLVCEGSIKATPTERVILCLQRVEDCAEALAVRGLAREGVIAVSGIAAGLPRAGAGPAQPPCGLPAPLLDARDPHELETLADLVLRQNAPERPAGPTGTHA